jgi:hypothetical protein
VRLTDRDAVLGEVFHDVDEHVIAEIVFVFDAVDTEREEFPGVDGYVLTSGDAEQTPTQGSGSAYSQAHHGRP